MKNFYDVQQLMKRYGVFVHLGNRLWDIELMAIEVKNLYETQLLDNDTYQRAILVLRREHRLEEDQINKNQGD